MLIENPTEESWLHRLDVRTKMLGFTGVNILAFTFQDPLYNLAIVLFLSILALSANMPFKKMLALLIPLLPIFLFIMIFSGFTYPPERFTAHQEVLIYLLPDQRLGVTAGGFLMGLTLLLRLSTMVLASSLLILATPLDDFIQLFNKLRIPKEVSFMITTAIRFIPTMNQKRISILEAQKARGTIYKDKGMIGPIKAYIPIMVPMIINSILMANTLSMAMLNRGYGYSNSWTNLREISLRLSDYLGMILILLITTFGLYLRIFLQKGVL